MTPRESLRVGIPMLARRAVGRFCFTSETGVACKPEQAARNGANSVNGPRSPSDPRGESSRSESAEHGKATRPKENQKDTGSLVQDGGGQGALIQPECFRGSVQTR